MLMTEDSQTDAIECERGSEVVLTVRARTHIALARHPTPKTDEVTKSCRVHNNDELLRK